jgi:hypothetical protein
MRRVPENWDDGGHGGQGSPSETVWIRTEYCDHSMYSTEYSGGIHKAVFTLEGLSI